MYVTYHQGPVMASASRKYVSNSLMVYGYTVVVEMASTYFLSLGETGPLSLGVQTGRKALRIPHIHGMEVRKKRSRGFKKRPRGFKWTR